jgi:general secretion pathway protein I
MPKLEIGMPNKPLSHGFTLIEVLLALLVVAIALAAMLKITAQDIDHTTRIKQKTIRHWVAMHGVALIQLKKINLPLGQETTKVTSFFNQRWYWRAKLTSTPIPHVQQIQITVSPTQTGPFTDPLIAYQYTPAEKTDAS